MNINDIRLISLGTIIVIYLITFGFLFMFAAPGLHEAEKQYPHAFDGHKYLNYNNFNSLMMVAPILGVGILISLVLIIVTVPNVKKQKVGSVE